MYTDFLKKHYLITKYMQCIFILKLPVWLSAAALKMFKYMCIDIDFKCMYIFDENSIMNEILGLVELI